MNLKENFIQLYIYKYYIIILVLFFITIIFNFDNCRRSIIKVPILKNIIYKLSQNRNEWIHNKISHLLPDPPATIMNLGCGLNVYSEYLEKLKYNVLAVDVNDVSVTKNEIIIYDGKNLPTCNYDVCILSTVLHHIPQEDHPRIMKMIGKCCKKLIVIEDDNDYFLTSTICMITNIQFYNHPMAFRNYNGWLIFFEKYCNILSSYTDKKQCVFHLEFKC
tara:strand:+ start:50 stop:706 length:657 start_codon:yes stop_codon:yes gene_type:complete